MTAIVRELVSLIDEAQSGAADLLDHPRAYRALKRALSAVHPLVTTGEVALDVVLDALDRDISAQVDEILHHPKLRAAESAWRGVKFVVDRVAFKENVRVEVLNCSMEDLLDDFDASPEIVKSGLYKIVYSGEYASYGGRPFGAIIANYVFGPGPADSAFLGQCGAVAACAAIPFITGFAPLPPDQPSTAIRFMMREAHRAFDSAKFVAGTWQRFAARTPFSVVTKEGARLEETARGADDRVWLCGSAIVAVAAAQSFAKWRIASDLTFAVDALDLDPPLSDALDAHLADHGVMSLARTAEGVRIASSRTWASPRERPPLGIRGAALTDEERALHHDLRSLFIGGRFVHYLKTLQRDRIGSWSTLDVLEQNLRAWLDGFIGHAIHDHEVKVTELPSVAWWLGLRIRAAWAPETTVVVENKLDKE
ncbi:MAG: type VI secretion system contractile sheath large subunit [Polyangiaceae bacterium]